MSSSTTRITLKRVKEVVGTISRQNSKLECANWSLPTSLCNKGQKLRLIENSVCGICYAEKIEKMWPAPYRAWVNNYELYKKSDRAEWIDHFIVGIKAAAKKTKNPSYVRWFPSGDIQDIEMLDRICVIARKCKNILFWLPSKQIDIISEYFAFNSIPNNLSIRVSSFMINQDPPRVIRGVNTSTVSKDGKNNKIKCPATWKIGVGKNGKCNSCKMCWNKKIQNIDYKLH